MKDQVMVDEMGKQPRISVQGPRGKKNPPMGQDAPSKSDPVKKPKSGLPRPWNTTQSSNTSSVQRRLKKSSQEISTTHIPVCSSIPVVKERPKPTLSTRACRPASRIPCPVSRLPNPGRSSGCHIRLKGDQGEKPEKVQKNQNPSLGPPSGLPPSVPAKGILTSINLPLKTEETSSTLQSSFMTFNNTPALLSTYQVLKEQHGEEISSLALLSPSSDTKTIALLPPDDLDLSTPEFVSDEVVASEIPHCKKHISNLALQFPEPDVQMEMLPNNLSKTGKNPLKYPHLSTLPKWPIPSSPTSLDFLSRVGQKKGSSQKKLGMFGSVSSTFSTKEFPESITGSPPSQDFVSSNHNDIPDTKILSPSYPLSSSSGVKEMVLSIFHDVSKEEELLLSSRTQIFTDIGSSNTSALSSEEKVLGKMEEEINSGNGCDPNENSSYFNLCILL